MRFPYLAITLIPLSVMSMAEEAICTNVVAATEAEVRVAMGHRWSDDMASLTRRTASAACMKSLSGRYGRQSPMPVVEPDTTADVEPDKDDSRFVIRALSGAPGKKPYERRRPSGDH